MARAPFVIGGIVAMLGGMAVTGGGVIAAGLDSDSSFTGDPVAGEGGLDPYVVGALVGGMLPMVGGSALLAYGAGHEQTVEPRTYTFDVEAPATRRSAARSRSPRDRRLAPARLVPSSTATAGDALNLQLAPISQRD